MFKKILNKIAGGVVGFFEGLVLGPFAAVGKLFSLVREESIGHDLRKNDSVRPTSIIVGIPLFFAGGLVYGPISGAILGINEGFHKDILANIAKEMFTYDPFYSDIITPEVANKIPESKLISYRTFRDRGLLNTKQNIPLTKLKLGPAPSKFPSDNGVAKKILSYFFESKNSQKIVITTSDIKTNNRRLTL